MVSGRDNSKMKDFVKRPTIIYLTNVREHGSRHIQCKEPYPPLDSYSFHNTNKETEDKSHI